VRTNTAIEEVAGGRVFPIQVAGGVWGACWYKVDPRLGGTARLVQAFLLLLGATTLVLATVLFFVLRREVLDPVTELTVTARRVASGDLGARVRERARDDELGELARSFNAMVGEVQSFQARLASEVRSATDLARSAEQAAHAERRLAATGKLAAGVAHEINNPLAGLLNAVERLERDDLPPAKRAQYLALLSSGLQRIRDTVGNLLRLTPRQSAHTSLSLAVPLFDALALVRHRAAQANVTLAVSDGRAWSSSETPPESLTRAFAELPRVRGSASELGQALLNLLVNALDALEAGATVAPRIEIVLRGAYEDGLGPAVTLDVFDNGPGVAPEELPRLVDPFYSTKEAGKGTGLGLSMVHSVVRGHGGRLSLDSQPGRGFHAHIALAQES
jgi:signal transduction histidine kinase